MQLWRISNFANLSGEGGLRYAARWHTAGSPIVYLAASPAGALIEVLVHLELDEGLMPEQYQLLAISAPRGLKVEDLVPGQDPNDICHQDRSTTQDLGNAWLRSRRSALAKIPSAILPNTSNYLLNPAHPDALQLEIRNATRARYDPRFFKQMR